MRRLLPLLAALAAALATSATSVAVAREHDRGGGEAHGHEGERGPPPGWARGGERGAERGDGYRGAPPPWARGGERGGGHWEQRQAPPPEAYGPPRGYYAPRRGGYLPPEARGGVVQDYGRYRLRPPPPGYGWVRSGRALMLMDMSSGQVFDVIPD